MMLLFLCHKVLLPSSASSLMPLYVISGRSIVILASDHCYQQHASSSPKLSPSGTAHPEDVTSISTRVCATRGGVLPAFRIGGKGTSLPARVYFTGISILTLHLPRQHARTYMLYNPSLTRPTRPARDRMTSWVITWIRSELHSCILSFRAADAPHHGIARQSGRISYISATPY